MFEVGYRGQVIAWFKSEEAADAYVLRVAAQYGLDMGEMWVRASARIGNEWVHADYR